VEALCTLKDQLTRWEVQLRHAERKRAAAADARDAQVYSDAKVAKKSNSSKKRS
jgi:hypothetical protein